MSNSETPIQNTQHAFLVAWGWFAEHLGLIQKFQALSLKQKHYHHRPQTKVLEFLVAILAGLQHLQDISLAAHPLDKDQTVAEAWGQADRPGVGTGQPTLHHYGVEGAALAGETGALGWRSDRHSRFQYQPDVSPCSLWAYG